MLRILTASLATCLAIAGVGSAATGQPASPTPSSTMLADSDGFFPSAAEVGEALGVELDAGGVRDDLGQWWEGIDLDPAVVESARTQTYRSPDIETAETWAGVIVEVVRFRSEADATSYGAEVAAITAPLETFETDLVADLVAAGSSVSDEGVGGSVIILGDGPVLVVVTAAKTGTEGWEAAGEVVAALVLDRLRGTGQP